MKNDQKQVPKNDALLFADEKEVISPKEKIKTKPFKLLIADDEKEVHVMTKLVLDDYQYQNSSLQFFSAYSGTEAKKLIADHPDAALILLDVVMESKDAGLEVAKFIREEQKNYKIRIILRTGQPGKAPEKDIILNYDINDYKEKTELTTQKLFTTITTALRSFIHLQDLDTKNKEIAAKNIRLNEEIARRIVAESNLTKYNRSLEKMINQKSDQLKKAIKTLKAKEKQLTATEKTAQIGEVSSRSIAEVDISGSSLKNNLGKINRYRTDMTLLLKKYEVLQNIFTSHVDKAKSFDKKSHEIIDKIDQFKKDIDLNEILKKYPNIIKESVKGIETISSAINDIKLFISISDESMEKGDINKILKQSVKMAASEFSSKIDIQTDYDTIPKISLTPKNLVKAFYQIIKNAFEAVGPQGIVSISTHHENDLITIDVCDNGTGISNENLNHIFKPYFTTKDKSYRGLGLSFAKSTILNHRGSISVVSSPKQGTNFTITIGI
ncbi:MAG: ATP-binding protein [Desulfobacula sp.]|nr:ATP-binding protein [Desulfobacula sp.]